MKIKSLLLRKLQSSEDIIFDCLIVALNKKSNCFKDFLLDLEYQNYDNFTDDSIQNNALPIVNIEIIQLIKHNAVLYAGGNLLFSEKANIVGRLVKLNNQLYINISKVTLIDALSGQETEVDITREAIDAYFEDRRKWEVRTKELEKSYGKLDLF